MRSEAVESLAGEVGESLLAFTFDDGPSEWTTRIAEAFSVRGGRATFFVIGDAVSGRENVLLSVDEQGHDIGNHSMTHRPLTGLDRASLMDELRGASERIQAVTGRWPLLLRPPYVLCDEAVLDAAGEIGMPWTVCTPAVPPDWLLRSAEEIANAVMVRVKRGAIISLHDGRPPHATPTGSLPTREATARAIDIVLENVSAEYRLVTVAELLAASGRGHGSLGVASPEMRSVERKQSDLK